MTAEGIGLRVTTAGGRARRWRATRCWSPPDGRPNGDQHRRGQAPASRSARWERSIVDEYGRTTAPGVWALGDVNGRYQLKHMANGEAKVIQHNLLHPDDLQPLDTRPAPHAVFGSPQIGAVGMTEAQADGARPADHRRSRHPYGGRHTDGRWRTPEASAS